MIYYAETNIIAILVGAILLVWSKRISSKNETSQIVMTYMLWLLILVSVSDIAAFYFRGKSHLGVDVANILYLIGMALGTFAWFLFVMVKTGGAANLRKTMLTYCAPVVLLCAGLATNHFHSFFFTVDEQLLYHRGPGILATWVVEWGYVLAALVANIIAVRREHSAYRKMEYRGYLLFAVPMAAAAVCQMLFYGITSVQIGYMAALLLVYLNKQYYQVQRDELTGLSNQNAFQNYQEALVGRSDVVTVFMMDLDGFKGINDTYGHVQGDRALREAAAALKAAVEGFSQSRVAVFRYGGDEFVVVGKGLSRADIDSIRAAIDEQIVLANERLRERGRPYRLGLSVGVASGNCENHAQFSELVRTADSEMYRVKAAKKATR